MNNHRETMKKKNDNGQKWKTVQFAARVADGTSMRLLRSIPSMPPMHALRHSIQKDLSMSQALNEPLGWGF
jgi:hypothetical protein